MMPAAEAATGFAREQIQAKSQNWSDVWLRTIIEFTNKFSRPCPPYRPVAKLRSARAVLRLQWGGAPQGSTHPHGYSRVAAQKPRTHERASSPSPPGRA